MFFGMWRAYYQPSKKCKARRKFVKSKPPYQKNKLAPQRVWPALQAETEFEP